MGFADSIDVVVLALNSFLEKYDHEKILSSPLSFPDFDGAGLDLTVLDTLSPEYPVTLPENAPEDKKEVAKAFKSSLKAQSSSFVLLMALTKSADTVISTIRQQEHLNQSIDTSLDRLALLLDLAMWTTKTHSTVSDFHLLLQTVAESFELLSTDTISGFWTYMESRKTVFLDHAFDRKVTLHRIAMLAICNGLTDKLYTRGKNGKLDSYEKDTFNDTLQARVRIYLSSILMFDDLTGLNKYFSIANRVNREPHIGTPKSGDEELLQEVLQFVRLLRDPYSYLKNPRMLSKVVDSMSRLSDYFLSEESKHKRRYPTLDASAIPKPRLKTQELELTKKYEAVGFCPEQYWLAPFEPIQRGPQFDAVREEDKKVVIAQFDSSKYRSLILLQIYLVSCFFLELQSSKKRTFLMDIHAPASTKHILEASTPESLVKSFMKLKRDISSLTKIWDGQLSFLLQQLSGSEENWWAWLLYAKRSDGSLVLAEDPLTEEEIQATKEKFGSTAPYKTKRYFNTYVTPQLSRRMRTQTGIQLLRRSGHVDLQQEIDEVDQELVGADLDTRKELLDKRTVLLWKKLKFNRGSNWLSFGDVGAELTANNDLICKWTQEKEKRDKENREKLEQAKLAKEKVEQERIEKEKIEKEKIEKEKVEKEKVEQENVEKEKVEKEKAEQEKVEKDKSEIAKSEKEKQNVVEEQQAEPSKEKQDQPKEAIEEMHEDEKGKPEQKSADNQQVEANDAESKAEPETAVTTSDIAPTSHKRPRSPESEMEVKKPKI